MAEQELKPRSSVCLSTHQYPVHTPSPKFSCPLHTWKSPLPGCGGDRGSWATARNWFKGWPWDLHILHLSMTKFLPCRKLLLPPALEEVLRNDATHLATEQKCLRPRMAPSFIHAAAQTKASRWKQTTSTNTVVLTNEEDLPTALWFFPEMKCDPTCFT